MGRVKIERRPLALITAECNGQKGTALLQNAETIALVSPKGEPILVTELKSGQEVLVKLEEAKGRHFGIEVDEYMLEK